MKIKVLIVEDDPLIAEAISVTLKKHSLEPVKICDSGEEAVQVFKNTDVDLVLMDIVLNGKMDGVAAAAMMLKNRVVPIIYLTDHTDQKKIDRALKTFPANYLTKPYDDSKLIIAIEISFYNAQHSSTGRGEQVLRKDVFVRAANQQFEKVALKDIIYLEASRSYCKVVTDNHTYTLCSSMNQVQEQFENADFMRVHRSYVVNTKRITKLDGNVIFLDKIKVDMGKEFRAGLLGALKFIK
jgi:DNA-binding LytR/AlgR family response regulator